MEASEVRIGNWIQCRQRGTDKEFINARVNLGHIVDMCGKEPYLERQPTPITKEILLNAGFNTRTTAGHSVEYFIGENPITHDWLFHICWLERNECPFYKNGHFLIHYVHQLQNLYRFLCGEELEINLTQEGQKL